MKQLSKEINRNEIPAHIDFKYPEDLPERVIQFGEGNFLRGFVDWKIHQLNKQNLFNGKVVAIQPTPHGKVVPKLNAQDGLYTLALRGIQNDNIIDKFEIISSISRGINPYKNWKEVLKVAESDDIKIVFSNTTEAGLTYLKEGYLPDQSPLSFPGKLAAFMYHRYQTFKGTPEAGLVIIPCELVENNGELLKELVIKIAKDWNLSQGFIQWVEDENRFCNTLVDRIVPGYPKENINEFRQLLGYEDQLLTVGEPYHLFAIDGDDYVAKLIPFDKVGLNVIWGDVTPYRELKVRLLNAPHTMMFAVAYLTGLNTVFEAMEDEDLVSFIKKGIYEEIIPVLPFDEQEKRQFVDSVLDRFRNPYFKHYFVDLGLNAVYKFKTRVVPILLEYIKQNESLPTSIAFSLAALLAYYRPVRLEGDFLIGKRTDDEYVIRDSKETISALREMWETYEKTPEDLQKIVIKLFEHEHLWGTNLNNIDKLSITVCSYLEQILRYGMKNVIENQ